MAGPKKFSYISVASDLAHAASNKIAEEYQTELLHSGGEQLNDNQVTKSGPLFYFVLTGGTEQKIYSLHEKRKEKFHNEPVFLLAHPGDNSLAASLEILARLKQENVKGKIIYLDMQTKVNSWRELEKAVEQLDIFHQLKKTRIGLIGNTSDWLIASMPDKNVVRNIWGPEVIQIDIADLENMISEITDADIEETQYMLVNNSAGIKGPSKKELKNVVKVYAALKNIINENKLNAVSIRCFDLVNDIKTSGCFAISKLNGDGLIAGCEGDIVSTLGMLWSNLLTDQIVWMANPASLDEQSNSIWLAHCSIPMSMVDKYKLRSHYESGLSVGIEGELSKGKATLFRLGGKNVDKVWISNAEILESGSEKNMCRTQVKIKLHGSYKPADLLTEPLGNHMLLLRGSYSKEMQEWHELFIG